MKKGLIGLGILVALAAIFAMALPSILKSRGLHPDYAGPSYELPGQRALIISTSHGVLNKPGETKGKKPAFSVQKFQCLIMISKTQAWMLISPALKAAQSRLIPCRTSS